MAKLSGVKSEIRTETRNDTGKEYQVTIVTDEYSVEDYRYRFLSFASEPNFGVDKLYALDTVAGQAVDFSSILNELEVDLGDGGQLIVLYPGETLQSLGIGEVTRDDILVTFLDFAPVYTPLSDKDFTFVEPAVYSGTEVEDVPALFIEVL